jgi:hypothetical protein
MALTNEYPEMLLIKSFKENNGVIKALCFLGNNLIASASVSASNNNIIRIWNVKTGTLLKTIQLTLTVYTICSLGNNLIASGLEKGNISIYDITTGDVVYKLEGHTKSVYALCSLGNNRMASGSGDNTIRIWNIGGTEPLLHTLTGHTKGITSICSLDNHRIGSGSYDSTVRIWNITDQTLLHTFTEHTSPVVSVCSLGNNRMASGSGDRTIRIWDIVTKTSLHTLTEAAKVNYICFLGNNIIVAGLYDSTCTIWNTETGTRRQTIDGAEYPVISICALDNYGIAIGSEDGDIDIFGTTKLHRITHSNNTTKFNKTFNIVTALYKEKPTLFQIEPICDVLGLSQHIGECWIDAVQELFFFTDKLKDLTQPLFHNLKESTIHTLLNAAIRKRIIRPEDKVYYVEGLQSMSHRFTQHYNFIKHNISILTCNDPTQIKKMYKDMTTKHAILKRRDSEINALAIAKATQSNAKREKQRRLEVSYIAGETIIHQINIFSNLLAICDLPFQIVDDTTGPILAIGIGMTFIKGVRLENSDAISSPELFKSPDGNITGHATGFLRCENKWYYYDNNYKLFPVSDAFIAELLKCIRENIPIGIHIIDRTNCYLLTFDNIIVNPIAKTLPIFHDKSQPSSPVKSMNITGIFTGNEWITSESNISPPFRIRRKSFLKYDYDGWSIIYGSYFVVDGAAAPRPPPQAPPRYTLNHLFPKSVAPISYTEATSTTSGGRKTKRARKGKRRHTRR